jgi:hypothetical protein
MTLAKAKLLWGIIYETFMVQESPIIVAYNCHLQL